MRELPHVVKFSGGRSSGPALTFMMAEAGLLKAERWLDVILFANTWRRSIRRTYAFAAECI